MAVSLLELGGRVRVIELALAKLALQAGEAHSLQAWLTRKQDDERHPAGSPTDFDTLIAEVSKAISDATY